MLNLLSLSMGCEYQPFILTDTQQIAGYEALSRFYDKTNAPIPPNQVFEQLHSQNEQLARVEYHAKAFQVANSNQQLPLFLNIDPHALDVNNCGAMLSLLSSREATTVEIIENTCISDAQLSEKLVQQLKQQKIGVALDDIGAPHSMLSLQLLSSVDCLKFDISWLQLLDKPEKCELFIALLNYAKATNKQTVLEGVETEIQLDIATKFGVDLVQGFLFKPWFVQPKARKQLSDILLSSTQILPPSQLASFATV
ncbi:EAL domain-containing protein [Shewanella electrodiphila]|uniref:EAL domain-containing protein n=1 Tax=Shewanella electrodiphila TaxID=934143 RepID=A0ABT0KNH1_9GAMM|nr:EAL domain-containing protein [Shewanella electrodiphila]MCL1045402.1 EAL domain-containing protein [Shewanella electrodiphila]